jgi:hypothetical protein
MQKHVKWDEQGLAQADHDRHSIPKRADRPPPEPKTPYIHPHQDPDEPDEGGNDGFRLSTGDSSKVHVKRELESSASASASEEELFVAHRRHHYGHDGEALAIGRALIESDPEI